MIEWYVYFIVVMGLMIFLSVIVGFLTREQIKLRLKCFLLRKGNNLLVTEMGSDYKLKLKVCELKDGLIEFGKNKTYCIKKQHTYLVPSYGITGVIVSENEGSSIEPNSENSYSAMTLNGLLKRVKATALGDALKILNYMMIVIGVFGLLILIQIFMIFKFYMALKTAGIEVAF